MIVLAPFCCAYFTTRPLQPVFLPNVTTISSVAFKADKLTTIHVQLSGSSLSMPSEPSSASPQASESELLLTSTQASVLLLWESPVGPPSNLPVGLNVPPPEVRVELLSVCSPRLPRVKHLFPSGHFLWAF